ncbi:hypothetical protein [Rhodoplanes sp. Z2-YC6860]|uniref:hypothetical protein n=1 Tax=Rhodoplanes sp. Z2-YC6860 TaxID=674703 RepID=UPI00078B4DB2|nr:hypothetical protein [Rhodoplanes sp. Z2-YC6860]AMN40887.1 hypothetical protein RHPLAN_24490 [Rhodoplanes sp. Z2-YC6860]
MAWIRRRPKPDAVVAEAEPGSLKAAVRQTRIEVAERSAVVVDLRDAELARLELLNEALDPLFKEIPPEVELFDRGISQGDVPRLWIDAIAHVAMGRDKRRYRFVQDTRYGRKVLAESGEIADIVKAVTHYVALRMIERDKALATDSIGSVDADSHRSGWRTAGLFLLGLVVGSGAVFAALWIAASQLAH